MNKKEFIEELKKINIEITNTQLEQLELYKEALEEALNKKVEKVYIYSVYLEKTIEI